MSGSVVTFAMRRTNLVATVARMQIFAVLYCTRMPASRTVGSRVRVYVPARIPSNMRSCLSMNLPGLKLGLQRKQPSPLAGRPSLPCAPAARMATRKSTSAWQLHWKTVRLPSTRAAALPGAVPAWDTRLYDMLPRVFWVHLGTHVVVALIGPLTCTRQTLISGCTWPL